MFYGGKNIKIIKIDLPSELKQIEIHIIADTHIGDANCDMAFIKNQIKTIAENPNAYCIANGDIVNWASKNSVSDCYSETLSPMQEIECFSSLFEPIKGKILALTQGNHEFRTYKSEGIDLTRIVARQLGIEDRYSMESALLFVRFGLQSREASRGRKMRYSIFVNHGTGGGRGVGAKAMRLESMSSIVDADIYVHSHTHLPMIFRNSYFRVDPSSSTVNLVDKLFVNTSSALNYGGYGERFEFKPASKISPIIYLNGTVREMNAKL